MKKLFSIMAIAVLAAVTFTSCSKDDETKGVYIVGFEEDYFTKLIDTEQNNGPLLYGGTGYSWTDKETTLTSSLTDAWGDHMFWGGGIAISNYKDADLTHGDADHQLSIPMTSTAGNWAIVYCDASMSFADGKAHVIDYMQVGPTTYELNVAKNGNSWGAKALTEKGDYLTLVITGYNGTAETGKIEIDMARDGQFLEDWATCAMSALGSVTKVTFTMKGSDNNSYGLQTPAYCAIDNIIVEQQ